MTRTNVIIPFFQREAGILPRAVNSVLAQHGADFQITVVDDGSPVRARDELASVLACDGRVVVIEQPNGGPGAARNRGLDATPDDCDQIAFLDSDDVWLPGHLANATTALSLGAEFYFADCSFTGYPREMGGRLRFTQCQFGSAMGQSLGQGRELYWCTADLFDHIFRQTPVWTSTVVVRRSIARNLRFQTRFHCGEDVFFWLELVRVAQKIAFSTRCEADCGRGVNIYGAATWGTPQMLIAARDMSRNRRLIANRFELTGAQRQWNSDWLVELRRGFASSFLHLIFRGKAVNWALVCSYLFADPRLIGAVGSLIYNKLFGPAHSVRKPPP